MDRATSFGTAASAYERYRLDYPDAVVDEVLSYAGRPVTTAIEIGAGTGKATRVFARRGIAVTATDPDADMLAELRRHVPGVASVVQAPLEELPPLDPVDLVFAASSLHWTDPQHRWRWIADLLIPGGVVASTALEIELVDDAVRTAVDDAWASVGARPDVPSPDREADSTGVHWPGTEMRASGRLDDVREVRIPQRLELSADRYTGLMSTLSAYLILPGVPRRELLARLRHLLPDPVTVTADAMIHLGRRNPI